MLGSSTLRMDFGSKRNFLCEQEGCISCTYSLKFKNIEKNIVIFAFVVQLVL